MAIVEDKMLSPVPPCLPSRGCHLADYFVIVRRTGVCYSIVDRIPKTDLSLYPLSVQLPEFCFSHNSSDTNPLPHFFTFLFTSAPVVYVSCLSFYQKTTDELQENESETCFCILSRSSYSTCFRDLLKKIYQVWISNGYDDYLQKKVQYIIDLIVPRPSTVHRTIYIDIKCHSKVLLNIPSIKEFPLIDDLELEILFQCLSIDNLIQVIFLILLENRIVLFSSSKSIPSLISQVLRALVYPFDITSNVYISRLPHSKLDIIESPVPYLVGLSCSKQSLDDLLYYCSQRKHKQDSFIYIVNLDKDLIYLDGVAYTPNKSNNSLNIPENVKLTISKRLKHILGKLQYVKQELKEYDNAYRFVPPPSYHLEQNYPAKEIQDAMICMFLSLLKNFFDCINTVNLYKILNSFEKTNSFHLIFDIPRFIQQASQKHRPFLKDFVKTTLFSRFIESIMEGGDCFDSQCTHTHCPLSIAMKTKSLKTYIQVAGKFDKNYIWDWKTHGMLLSYAAREENHRLKLVKGEKDNPLQNVEKNTDSDVVSQLQIELTSQDENGIPIVLNPISLPSSCTKYSIDSLLDNLITTSSKE